MEQRYDVIVIGSGPAGLSAAVTLKLRGKNVLVIGSETVSEKVQKAHTIENYLGLPGVTGEELSQRFLNHARDMGIAFRQEQIYMVYSMGKYFSLASRSNRILEAKAVILAMGISFGKPYPGEEAFLGRGVSYCATCDAPLYRGKRVVVIGDSPKEEAEAAYLAEVAGEVTYIPLYKEDVSLPEKVHILREKPLEIRGGLKADTLVHTGGELSYDGLFLLRTSVSPGQLVPGLTLDGSRVPVNRKMETNLPGCFACGDLVGAPYQYIKAAGEGNVAALSAVEYLRNLTG